MEELNKEELEDILISLTASLSAAVSLLKRSNKKAAGSDKMFDLMIEDYEKTLSKSRAFIKKAKAKNLL